MDLNLSGKKMKKIFNNPLYKNMINNINPDLSNENLSLKDKLHMKIENCRMTRGNNNNNKIEKKSNSLKEKIKKLDQVNNDKVNEYKNNNINNLNNIKINDIKKKYNKKIKDLEKYYGEISEDIYLENLNYYNNNKNVNSEELNKSINIINLYIKQHKSIPEKDLLFSDDDSYSDNDS